MYKSLFKKWYFVFSFFLSVYLIIVTVLGFTSVSPAIMKSLNKIAFYILWFFVLELFVLFITRKDFKSYIMEQWIGIIAVLSALSVTLFVDVIVGIGSLTGIKALKGLKAAKAIKGLKATKGIKVFKATKGAKLAKSVKIGKKAIKTHNEIEQPIGE